MSVSIDRVRITPAERFLLVVNVFAPKGTQVQMPSFSEHATGLVIHDHREYPPKPSGDRRWWRQEYRLDAFQVGEHTIPRLTATFTDLRPGPESATEGKVTTEELTVTVEPLLEEEADPTAFRDIKGPVALPTNLRWMWVGCTIGALGMAVILTTVVVRLKRRVSRTPLQEPVSPHQWAIAQLTTLTSEQLIERGLVREFYFRLNMIVRQYIARQFHLMAPERTTEELVRETQQGTTLPHKQRETLDPFLTGCDMVKYARHTPGTEEIEGALNAAWDFVSQSAASTTHEVTTA